MTESTEKSKKLVVLQSATDQAPTFPMDVVLTKLDGTKVLLELTCKAMGKKAWAAIRRQHMEDLTARAEKLRSSDVEGAAVSRPLDQVVAEAVASDASLVMQFVTDWSLKVPLTAQAMEELEDSYGGAMNLIVSKYEGAVYHGQLGNSARLREQS